MKKLPLFTSAEEKKHQELFKKIEAKYRDKTVPFDNYWEEREALQNSRLLETVKRAQARPEDFLNGLLIIVGSRGSMYFPFEEIFTQNLESELEKLNTPEARRNLFTILTALKEVPKSWARSAFVRFLRGTGKQKNTKYHGAGVFGLLYGWKEQEIDNICKILFDGLYGNVILKHADIKDEIHEADPEYTVTDYDVQFKATRIEKDVDFLTVLTDLLEKQGLGQIPTPQEAKPKKIRVPKKFKPGDVLRQTNLRDLPLPARIRLTIEKMDKESNQWIESTIEQVITQLIDGGDYIYAWITKPGDNTAYQEKSTYGTFSRGGKRSLEGAIFLGKWEGKIVQKKGVRPNFGYRIKHK